MTEYKVYKMINDDMPGLVYYGSTMNTLKKRLNGHKNSKKYKSSKLFEIGEPKIIQLNVFDNELDMYKKEKEYIENNECLNVVLPSIKKKDYSKGKIYKIINDDMPGLVYYGSTIQTLKTRFCGHRKNLGCTSRKLFETDNVKIELVEDYPCETKRELEIKEKYYILKFECLNIKTPALTIEEKKEHLIKSTKKYRKDNKKSIKEYSKKWKQKNPEKVKEWREKNPEKSKEIQKRGNEKRKERAKEEKIICECGSTVVYFNIRRHERTIKHKNYLDNI